MSSILELTAMDYFIAAIANARAEGMDLEDVWACLEHAKTPADFDRAVNLLTYTMRG